MGWTIPDEHYAEFERAYNLNKPRNTKYLFVENVHPVYGSDWSPVYETLHNELRNRS